MPLSCLRRTTGDGAFAVFGPARTSRAASTSAIWRRSSSISSISRRISAFSWSGSGRPSPVRAASSSCRRSLCSGLKSVMPCPASRPLMRFVCRIRSCNSIARSRHTRRRSSSSGVGGTTIAQTRGSPRVHASSVLRSVSPSIASVLARRRRLGTAMDAGSTT